MTLTEFWKSGPWVHKGDLRRCENRWKAALSSQDGLRRLLAARDAYTAEMQVMYRLKRRQGYKDLEILHFVLHLCTWLGRWEEWAPAARTLFDERTEALVDEEPEKHGHVCDQCAKSHTWLCLEDVDECWKPVKYPCSELEAQARARIVAVKA